MFTRRKIIATTLSAALLLSTATGNALAENHHHSHESGSPAQLVLNNGAKWVTDSNLRKGMEQIRDALAAGLPAIHADKMTAGQYRALAKKINQQTEFIVKHCKLDQKTDAMLHLVLADIMAGTDSMLHDSSKARPGAEKIMNALDNYAKYFDHPGWQAPHAGH